MRRTLMGIAVLCAALAPGAPAQNRARELAERVIANQHRDDAAIYKYERVEQRISYQDHSTVSDEIYRLVPTGTGRLSLLIERGNQPVDLATYQKELRNWVDALHVELDPRNPRERQLEAKRQERERKRAELIDAVSRAFHFKWLGEDVENGRTVAKIELDPNPSFQPRTRETEMLRHVRATVWIDERAAQLVRARAEITSSINVAGGILAKVYRGGWFEIQQAKVAPGIWFPERSEYWIHGRVVVVSETLHKLTKDWDYRWVGSPEQALELAQKNLASNALFHFQR
jgi:hypothetical protein